MNTRYLDPSRKAYAAFGRGAVWLACVVFAACGGGGEKAAGPTPPAPVATVQVTPDSSDVVVGGTRSLSATLRDASGATLSGRLTTWTSSDPSIVTVSGAGLATAVLPGRVTITATAEGRAGTAVVRSIARVDTLPGSSSAPAVGAIQLMTTSFNAADFAPGSPGLGTMPVSFNTVVVRISPQATIGQVNQLLVSVEAQIAGGVPGVPNVAEGIIVLRLPTQSHADLQPRLGLLEQSPIVRGVSLDKRLRSNATTRPPTTALIFPLDWTVAPSGGNWGLEAVHAPQMWNLNDGLRKTGRRTLTGVFDEGFAQHTGLNYHTVLGGFSAAATHGTHVAGIIGATFDDGVGTDGITPFADLVVQGGAISFASMLTGVASLMFQQPQLRVVNLSMGYNWHLSGLDTRTDTMPRRQAGEDGATIAALLQAFAATPGTRLPVIVAAAGNDSDTFPDQDARFSSPFGNAAIVLGAAPIIIVEALELDAAGTQKRSSFSNKNGHVSAPGSAILSTVPTPANGYDILSGTSMATPLVAGLVSYLYTLDPTLPAPTMTANPVRDLLVRTADPVTGAAPRINAFTAAMEVDHERGGTAVLRMLADMDDGTADGNTRVGADQAATDADGDGGRGDGAVDMSDFRRFRDALLQAENAAGTSLNGPASHPKKDLNGDGRVESAALENVFPRADLNGDGQIDRASVKFVYGVLRNRLVTDLEVLRELFQDPDYTAAELPSLLDSGDLTIRGDACLTVPGVARVRSSIRVKGTSVELDDRDHSTSAGTSKIYTIASAVQPYTARIEALDAQGAVLGSDEQDFTIAPGSDAEWDPVCLAIELNAAFPSTVNFNTPVALSITVGVRDLISGQLTPLPNIPLTLSATGGSVAASSGTTNASGVFATTATLPTGSTRITITITAHIATVGTRTITKSAIPAGQSLAMITFGLPAGGVGLAYDVPLLATGGTTGTYQWDITAGALPAGLTLSADPGRISGTPTTEATVSITLRVRSGLESVVRSFLITIYNPRYDGLFTDDGFTAPRRLWVFPLSNGNTCFAMQRADSNLQQGNCSFADFGAWEGTITGTTFTATERIAKKQISGTITTMNVSFSGTNALGHSVSFSGTRVP